MIALKMKSGNLLSGCIMEDAVWTIGRVPNGFWDRRSNRVAYMNWLGERLGFDEPDDWYQLQRVHFQEHFGSGLLVCQHNDSPLAALCDYMPQQEWLPWLMCRTPNGYWTDPTNRRKYMRWLQKELGITRPDQWYQVTKDDFVEHGGNGLLANYYKGSVAAAVLEFRPRRRWYPWLFNSAPQGFWRDIDNRRQYLDWLAGQLGVRTTDQWYGVTTQQMIEHHGHTLLATKGYSILNVLREYLPNHDWKPWLFERVPVGFWETAENRHAYLVWLGETLGYSRPSDWYEIEPDALRRTGAAAMFSTVYRNNIKRALHERYPRFKWNIKRMRHANNRGNGNGATK